MAEDMTDEIIDENIDDVADVNIVKSGYIYIMTNPSIPDYVKIGYAADVEKRRVELSYQTACPLPFRISATYSVDNMYGADTILHDLIDLVNMNCRTRELDEVTQHVHEREFFELSEEDACQILESIAKMSGTEVRFEIVSATEVQRREMKAAEAARNRQNSRRGNFSFAKCGIPVGEEVELVGHPEIKARVLSDTEIEYEDRRGSLSGFAAELLEINHTVQGTIYWTYRGQLLDDRRKEMEAQGLYK